MNEELELRAAPNNRFKDERQHFRRPSQLLSEPAAESVSAPKGRNPSKSWRYAAFRSFVKACDALRNILAAEFNHATPFLFAPVFMASGAVLYFASASEPRFTPLVLGIVVLLIWTWLARAKHVVLHCIVAVLLILTGSIAGKLETWRTATPMLGSAVTTTISGWVTRIEHRVNDRTRLTIAVINTRSPRLRHGPAVVRVTMRGEASGIIPGSVIEGRVRLIPPQGPVKPGGYDFAFHNYFDRIGAIGFFLGQARLTMDTEKTGLVATAIIMAEQSRHWLTQRIKLRIGGYEGEIAAALITGAKSGIPDEINEALRRTGLAHILSISGLHMALVAGTVVGALRLVFACFPIFASNFPVRKFAAATGLSALFFYLLISGAGIATQRSFIMLAVMLTAMIFDRPAISMRNLAIAAIVIVALSPHEVTGPGFQMSFAATAALVAAYRFWSVRRMGMAEQTVRSQNSGIKAFAWKIVSFFGALAATSLIAGIATAIFGIWHFHRVAPLGLPANLAAMPIVSLVVMPSAVLAMILLPFDLDGPFFSLMGNSIKLVVATAQWFSERSPVDAVGAIPASALVLASAALVLVTLPATRLRLLALPFAGACALAMLAREMPDILISEDARLVGVLNRETGRLALNRTRANAFTLEIWQQSVAVTESIAPTATDQISGFPATTDRFFCSGTLCLLHHQTGAVIAYAADAHAAIKACTMATILIIADATVGSNICGEIGLNPTVLEYDFPDRSPSVSALARQKIDCDGACKFERLEISRSEPMETPTRDMLAPAKPALILTARDLARYGSASIKLDEKQKSLPQKAGSEQVAEWSITLETAVSLPFRPWHAQRAWSREARGLSPYGIERD